MPHAIGDAGSSQLPIVTVRESEVAEAVASVGPSDQCGSVAWHEGAISDPKLRWPQSSAGPHTATGTRSGPLCHGTGP
jgi:hypothetical protein